LFSIGVSACRVRADLNVQRLADQPHERRRVAVRSPQFQLRITGGPDLEQGVVAAVVQLQPGYGL
jgi:hypothetical protein